MKLTDCNGTICALFSGQHFTTATVGKTSCCVILVVIAFLCIGQSAVNPASLEHLGYEGDTIVCDQTDGPWYIEWTVSEILMQGDYNYNVQVCAVDTSQLAVYNYTKTLRNKLFFLADKHAQPSTQLGQNALFVEIDMRIKFQVLQLHLQMYSSLTMMPLIKNSSNLESIVLCTQGMCQLVAEDK